MRFNAIISKFLFGFLILGFSATNHYSQNPPGKMIEIDATKLHLYCTGSGSQTIVLDAGAGGWSIHWTEIQKEIAKTNRVCSYDRAGLGWSEGGTMPRTAKQAAIELNQLLTKSKEKAPFVLVGHSFGGYVARIYYDLFPKEVAGIALIDSAHESQWEILPGALQMLQFGIADFKQRFEKLNSGEIEPEKFSSHLPKNLIPIYHSAIKREKTQKAFLSEMENSVLSAEQVSKTKGLGNLPLLVLSAGNSFAAFISGDEKNKSMLENLNKSWMEMQNDLALLSTNSEHLISQNAKHTITSDKPKLVAYSINLLTDLVKK